jgi:TetR/AcrR family transcriptional regulator
LTRRSRHSDTGPVTGSGRRLDSSAGGTNGQGGPCGGASGDTRHRILSAAIREFAESGYAKASTNNIVRDAGTSKGLLFHYFGSKGDLYLAALEHCIQSLVDFFMENLGDLPKDPVDRFVTWADLKVRMLAGEPLMYKMAMGGIGETPPALRPRVQALVNRVGEELMPVFLNGIDFSGLREDVDPGKAVQYILLVFGAISERYLEVVRNSPDKGLSGLASAMNEIRECAEFVKRGLYRDKPE